MLLDYSSDDALRILGKYSEETFDKVMKTVDYLERRTSSTLELINCYEGEMGSLFLQLPDNSKINLLHLDSEEELSTLNYFSFLSN